LISILEIKQELVDEGGRDTHPVIRAFHHDAPVNHPQIVEHEDKFELVCPAQPSLMKPVRPFLRLPIACDGAVLLGSPALERPILLNEKR
jgi:hypothetical protein